MFRNGQWLAFDDNDLFANAFRARNGKAVGIFHTDGFVHVVTSNGENCMTEIDGVMVNVTVAVHEVLPSLEWISDRRDIPPERIKHLPEDWQPTQ